MSQLGIVEPKTLIGEAVRDALIDQKDVWDQVELFTTDSEAVGAVSEVAGRAALVQLFDKEDLGTLDVLIYCDRDVPLDLLEALPERCRTIFIDPASPVEEAIPVVAGINDEQIAGASRVVSPSPALLMLSHLLAPLRELDDIEVTAHVLQPASARGKAGLDELFEQTRAILSMSDERPEEVFGTQLAFNLLPWVGSSAPLEADLGAVLGVDLEARILLSQAGVFHCCAAGIFLGFSTDPGVEKLQQLLLESRLIEQAENPELLGPIAAAATTKILVGEISPSSTKGYWLWSCIDNLTSSASNALALART